MSARPHCILRQAPRTSGLFFGDSSCCGLKLLSIFPPSLASSALRTVAQKMIRPIERFRSLTRPNVGTRFYNQILPSKSAASLRRQAWRDLLNTSLDRCAPGQAWPYSLEALRFTGALSARAVITFPRLRQRTCTRRFAVVRQLRFGMWSRCRSF